MKRAFVLAAGIALASTIVLSFTFGVSTGRAHQRVDAISQVAGYLPSMRLRKGTERVAIFIGSSTCGAAEDDRVVKGLPILWADLARGAREKGMSFSTIGIAVDWRVSDGMGFLQKLGWFDEVMTGRNWLNQGAYRFIFSDLAGPSSVPQILLIERDIDPTQGTVQVLAERIVDRKVGLTEIVAWIETLRSTKGGA